jgi:predicted alpha/beta superfamily hydrolase
MLRVYFPTSYDNNKKFDVLYMHDGHNLFDKESSYCGVVWDVHTTLDKIEKQYHRNVIVVGIDCDPVYRLSEYSPWKNENLEKEFPVEKGTPNGGEGTQYIEWLVNSLIPFINNKYRTTNVNYLAGSSMGGLISLYAGYKYPEVFTKIGAFSPSIWFAKKEIFEFIDEHYCNNLHVYLDIGSNEFHSNEKDGYIDRYCSDAKEMESYLRNKGSKDVKFVLEIGAKHNEAAWARRFPIFIKWLLDITEE